MSITKQTFLHLGQWSPDKLNVIHPGFQTFFAEEDGQDLVEYSLLLAFIALAAVAILSSASSSIKAMWTNISTALGSAATAAS